MNEYMISWAQVYATAFAMGHGPNYAETHADLALAAIRKREQKGMFAPPAPRSYREAPNAYPYPDLPSSED